MTLRTFTIWLLHFWFVVPGVAAALGAGWLLWGMGFMWSVVVPLGVGAGVFLLFLLVDMAVGLTAFR
jgi:hypothetical protein